MIVAAALLTLIAILGVKAYSVVRTHLDEIHGLLEHDLEGQSLLVKMETIASSREQAARKYKITHDPAYAALVAHYGDTLAQTETTLRETLARSYPDFATKKLEVQSAQDIQKIRRSLDVRREEKLTHARDAAHGILKLIITALFLTIAITAWIIHLMYRGILRPMEHIKAAADRIGSGDFAYRIENRQGVRELRDLASSFNTMGERLQNLDMAKAEFLATISHEIKNPLAALKEGLIFLSSRGDMMLPQAKSKAFAACTIASKRLESMINNLLNHARMETGLFEFDLTPKDLNGVIQTAIDETRPLLDKKGMQIRFSCPDGASELNAAFNWDGMVQVFENLILNAIKYGQENSTIDVVATRVTRPMVTGGEPIPHIEISVSNSGTGLKESDIPRLFESFYRGANSGQKPGLGLGLHVVKRIIEAHHGDVAADSSEGRTRFSFWIPNRYESEAI